MEITVDNRVRVPAGSLPGEVARALRAAFEHRNPVFAKRLAQGFSTAGEPEILPTWREESGALTFPRGGFRRVREVLSGAGFSATVQDRRTLGVGPHGVLPDHKLVLRGYQRMAADAMLSRENCLLRAGTGAGKTTVGFALAAQLKLPTLVVVWTGALFDQWQQRASSELGFRPGVIRATRCELKPLTIAMQQTLAARGVDDAMRGYFGVVICDEVQRFAARTLFDCVDPFPAKYRFGISADESRKDGKEFLIHDLFGTVAADIPRERLADEGHVLEVEVRIVPSAFKADWFRRRVAQGNARSVYNDLLDAMTADERRNKLIVDLVSRELAQGERAFVLSHRRDHCRLLDAAIAERGYRSGLLLGAQESNAEFKRTLAALNAGAFRAGVGTYQAIGQGLDVPPVSVAVCTTPVASHKQLFGQVRGRVCRTHEGKKSARAYVIHDLLVFGKKAIVDLTKWNRRVVVWSQGAWTPAEEYLQSLAA